MSGAFDAGTVSGRLILDIKEWSANIEKAEKDTKSLGGVVQKNKDDIEKLGKSFAAAGAAITAALGIALKKTADYGDELWKTSQKTGIAVETLSGLKLAADKSDLSLQLLAGGLAKMSRTFVDANDGMKEYQEVLAKLGVKATDSSGKMKSMDTLLDEIADKFAVMPDGVEKTALAMDIFGKSGAQMIPLLNLGSDGLRAEREEAERLGLVMSGPAAKAGEVFNDTITTLKKSFLGISITIGQALMPPLKMTADVFTFVVSTTRKLLDILGPVGKALTNVAGGAGLLLTAIGGVTAILPKFLELKGKLSGSLKLVDSGLKAVKLSLGFVTGALVAGTIAAEATRFAFQKLHESQDRAIAGIVESANKAGAGWKFAQASIRGETDVTGAKMKELIARWREMGKSSEEIGEQIASIFKNKIATAAKAAAKDTEDVATRIAEVQRELTDKLKSLTLDEFEYRIWQAQQYYNDTIEKAKGSVQAEAIAAEAKKVLALEVAKVRKEQAEAAAEAEAKSFGELIKRANALVKPVTGVFGKIDASADKLFSAFVKSTGDAMKKGEGAFVGFGAKTNAITIDTGKKVKKSFSDVASSINQTIQILQQGFGQFFSGINQLSQQRYQAELARMDREYQERKKQIEDSLLTEEEKTKKLEELDAEFAEKKKAAEIKQAAANKKSSLMQAIVNTALAVTSALSTKPFFPMGLIAAAAALAAGYIQVRIIQNQSVPAMAEGGLIRQPTHVLAGEAGPEAILPMRELKRMLGVDRKSGVGSKTVNVNINAIDTRGMESYARRAVIPEIRRAFARESLTVSPNAVR